MLSRVLKIAAATCALIALWQLFGQSRKSEALSPLFDPPPMTSDQWPRSIPGRAPISGVPDVIRSAPIPNEPGLLGPLLIASADPIVPLPLPTPESIAAEMDEGMAIAVRLPEVTPEVTMPPAEPPSATEPPTAVAGAGELPAPASSDPAAPTQSDGETADAKPADKDKEKDKKLGEEPPNTAIDIFRQSAVLLPVGVLEWECGLQYTLFNDNFLTILPSSTIVPQRTSSRTFLASTSLRYGYNEVLQPYLTVPAGMSTVETANSLSDFSNDEYGIGDVLFGASYLLRDGHDECADIVFGLTCVAPTGKANFLSIVPGNASLGNGFWILSPSLTWTRTYDPVVVYATASYLHRFEREHFGVPVTPGEEFDLGYGAGFAINDSLTYSLQFQWAHQFDTKIDGQPINDSGADIASIRQGAIFRITPQRFFEAFFANGVTDNSPEISTGVLLTQRY